MFNKNDKIRVRVKKLGLVGFPEISIFGLRGISWFQGEIGTTNWQTQSDGILMFDTFI